MASQAVGQSEIAGRYATALVDLAEENKCLDVTAGDLRGLEMMLTESADLRRLVKNPVITRAEQSRAMAALLARMGVSTVTRNFVGLVIRNRRLFALPAMIAAYLDELARRRGEVTAEVSAAAQLTEEQMRNLAETLQKVLSARVSVELKVDPSLLGGLIVKVGSRLFDFSLRTKLHKLELAMKGIG